MFLTETELATIREATTRAEARTGGEIVPYLVARVDDHEESRWRWAALGAVAAAAVAGIAHDLLDWWGLGVLWISLPTLLGALAGLVLLAALGTLARVVGVIGVCGRDGRPEHRLCRCRVATGGSGGEAGGAEHDADAGECGVGVLAGDSHDRGFSLSERWGWMPLRSGWSPSTVPVTR